MSYSDRVLKQTEADEKYWKKYLTFFPKGWKLSGFSYRQEALFVSDKESCTFTKVHAEVIDRSIASSRLDSKIAG